MRDWFEENWVYIVLAVVGIIAIATIIFLCVNYGGNDETNKVTEWLINPSNPSSPIHNMLP